VRRFLIHSLLSVILLCAGSAALFCAPISVAATLLALSAVSGAVGLITMQRACGRLTARISEICAQQQLRAIAAPTDDLEKLAGAVNELAAIADRAVADERLRAREMEIQLKVATAQRQHARAILYSISDAVLVTDSFDELVLANEAAARTFDFDLARAKRERAPVDQVLRDPTVIELIRQMRQNHAPGGKRIVEHTVNGNGMSRTFKITLSCVESEDRAPAGVVAVLHDMTREKEVAQMKNDFVSNVSHELRTPLASIKAYVEMLIDGEAQDNKTQQEFYEVIQNEANRLGRLIDNILNISRIESGLVKIEKHPQSLAVIVKEAMEVIAPQAMLKNIGIDEKLSPIFYQTLADHDMLYQAVLNLLSNAVKYTPDDGQITVETGVDADRKKIFARITDTGVGIPPKDLPFVFDKFYRSQANTRMAKGTGLGLSLVKHIVETVHQGKMFVESQVGKGSAFGFEMELCE